MSSFHRQFTPPLYRVTSYEINLFDLQPFTQDRLNTFMGYRLTTLNFNVKCRHGLEKAVA